MQTTSFEEALEQIILPRDQRYHRDAYLFLRDALDHTRKLLDRESKAEKPKRGASAKEKHVTGQELLEGIRDLALQMFGPMTVTVFEEWGVRACPDFGEMVFILVENRLLKKTEKDSRADFENGYDFYETFQKPFLPQKRPTRDPESPGVPQV